MILTEPSSDNKQAQSPTSPLSPTSPVSSSSSERTPLLPSTIDPPPSYSPPSTLSPPSHPSKPKRRYAWIKVLLLLVVVGLILGWLSWEDGEVEQEEGGGGGEKTPEKTNPLPGLPSLPEKEKEDKSERNFKGRRWDSTLYLPHLSETHNTSPSGSPYVCNRVLPASTTPNFPSPHSPPTNSSSLSTSSSSSSRPAIIRSAYALPLSDTLLLFLHFGAVQRRAGVIDGGGKREVNVAPKGTVSFLPWREEDIILKGEEWLEDTVWVLVEREEEDGKAARAGGGGVEVCAMEGRDAAGVGLFSSSPNPPVLNVTVFIPTSPNSDRTLGRFCVEGLEGDLVMGDMEPDAFDLDKSLQEKSWTSFEVKAKKAAIYIKSLAAHALSLSTENSSVSLENVRITNTLEVKTTGQGTYFGNVSIVAGGKAAVHTEAGNSRSIISLITAVPYSALPHLDLPVNAVPDQLEDDEEEDEDQDQDDEDELNLPSLPGKTKPLPSLAPIKMDFTSTHGNITAAFQRHFYHVPLQATITSNTGSVGVNLSPHFQGSLRLSSPIEIKHVLPEETPFPLADPYDLGRKFRVVLTDVKYLVTGYMGWGFAGKPDMAGSLVVHTNKGVIGVARFGGRVPFEIE